MVRSRRARRCRARQCASISSVMQMQASIQREVRRSSGPTRSKPFSWHTTGMRQRRAAIRPSRFARRGALSRICIEESNLGTLKDLAPVFFLDPYCDDDPSSCFVAELEGEVVGYWVGTLDVDKLRRGFPAYLMRRSREILGRYGRAWRGLSWREHRWFWRQVLLERFPGRRRLAFIVRQVGELFGKTYVHFQLDRAKAPAGTVFALARAWLQHLRPHGVQGAMLPSVPGGPAAGRTWERLGFAPLQITPPNGSPRTPVLVMLYAN